MRVRDASPDDADAMGRVHVRAWQAAYRGAMPDDYLDNLDPAQRAEMWRRAMAAPQPRRHLLVAVGDMGDVTGFAACGPANGNEPEGAGELYAINLDPGAWRRGGGSQLIAEVERRLADDGYDHVVLWVEINNDRARRFYEAHGWAADGAEKTDDALGAVVREVRYAKRGVARQS